MYLLPPWPAAVLALLSLFQTPAAAAATTRLSSYKPNITKRQDDCTALAHTLTLDIDLPFTVNFVHYMPSNATLDLVAEGTNATCLSGVAPLYPIPVAVCRVGLRVETSKSSQIYMETWLPENWAGRTLMTGNGGFAGCMFVPLSAFRFPVLFLCAIRWRVTEREVFISSPDVAFHSLSPAWMRGLVFADTLGI